MAHLTDAKIPSPPDHLFTWVDVDEHLSYLASEGAWPQWLHAADSWWDSLELVVSTGTTTTQVREWLDEVFGAGSTDLLDGTVVLGLDDPRTSEFTGIPVTLVGEQEATTQTRRLPLLREKHITRELANPLARPSTDRFAADVQIVAFHSFKGGVGRTLHAVAVADLIARRGGRVLLVDADLEAPGITWMHTAQGGQRDFSYQDFLSLLQGDENGNWSSAVDIAAAYLPNQQVGQYRSGGRLTVVPASRRSLIYPARIEPADLLTPDRSPYFLTEALAALADETGADTVVVDLRAGASELSAPVLLDPRVQRVFVTTLSHQSLAGTELLVRQLGRRAPAIQGTDPATSVIITQYRHDVHAAQAEAARAELSGALVSALAPSEQDPSTTADSTAEVDTDILSQPVLSPFREELLALPSSWNDVLHVLESCKVSESLDSIVPAPIAAEQHPSGHEPEKIEFPPLRHKLTKTANDLIVAEKKGLSSASGFLVTDPLRRLLGDHRTEPPLSLVVGAKGAGKTFMYTKACAARRWNVFAEQSGIEGVRLDSRVVPVLESEHLVYDELTPQLLREEFAQEHESEGEPATTQEIRDHLKRGLVSIDGQDELAWRRLWLECLAAAAGTSAAEDQNPETALTELGKRAHAVFVIDGLEDLLQSLDNESQRTALRVLLTDVLAWLRSLRGRPFGLVIFVRPDLVTGAVKQNSAQLLSRYEPYTLRWDKEQALRLALWLAAYSEALPRPIDTSIISELPYDELVQTLIPVWGWKMGSEKSKEARSHLWVPAALKDFNDQVQARDVVVFLAEAAKLSDGHSGWDDRLLAPTAMRKAMLACSKNKISSIQEENLAVGDLLHTLQQVPHSVTVPFTLDQVGISVSEADFLVDSGVLAKGRDGRYWMAEIYRHGVGFGSERRAKVLWRN